MEAITREEKLMSGQQLEPITRKELFLAKAAGMDVKTPEPITREEMFLSKISGGGSSPVVEPLSVTENGTYTAPSGVDGYNPVTVNVAGSGDDGSFKAVIERTAAEITLPDGLTSIGSYVFHSCTNLALTSLPSGITSIGDYTFYNCTNLALTSLPSGITSIRGYAFYSCSQMTLKSIPASVETIKSRAFQYCTGLTEITFNGTPTTISNDVFKGCSDLLTINVPWAEGEVSGAPWGATNATINYNYTGG